MATLDEITKEKQRVGDALARVDAQRQKLAGQLGELEATERVLARYRKGTGPRKTALARTRRQRRRLLQRAHTGALGPQRQLLAVAPRPPSRTRCLPWRPARRNRKSLPHARALARPMSAPRSPGTNGLAALRSATGSSTPYRRARQSNAPRSDAERKDH